MVKATLTFELPADRMAYDTANRSLDYKFAIMDIATLFRNTIKYYDGEVPESYYIMQEKFFEILEIHRLKDVYDDDD